MKLANSKCKQHPGCQLSLYIYWSIERPTQFYARAVFITDLAPQFHISFDSPVPSPKSWQPILH